MSAGIDRRTSNSEEWNRDRPFVDLPEACWCLIKLRDRPCGGCVARAAVAAQGVGE